MTDGFAKLADGAPTKALSPRAKLIFGIAAGAVAIGAIIAISVVLTLPVPYTSPPAAPESCAYSGYRLQPVARPVSQSVALEPLFDAPFTFTGATEIILNVTQGG